jgi:serpin B
VGKNVVRIDREHIGLMEMCMKPLISLLVTCLVLPVAVRAAELPTTATSDQAEAVRDNNAFAIELYGQLHNRSGNLFFSPESISTALAMTYAGARGDTAAEMAKTLHFTLPPGQLHPAMGALLRDRNAAHVGYQLKEADALWVQQGYSLLPEFLKLNKDNYEAGLNQLDFKGATEASRQTINLWVEQRTENKIRELLQPGILTPDTRLVLTNAIYFKGDWEKQFKKEDTKDEDFHPSATQAIKTPLMHMTSGIRGFNYFDGGSFQALEIPYKNKELSMIILLPKAMEGLSAFEQSLSPANIQQLLEQLRPAEKVIVTMPKFKIEAKFELGGTLIAMGMKKAFDVKMADFTGMASRKTMQRDGNLYNFYISAVIHKAYVDVDEEGTEATAATAVGVKTGLTGVHRPEPPIIIFRADHPFMFLIRDNHSGSILFIGRVTNPSGVTLSPGDAPTNAEESYDPRAVFKAAQQKRMQGAENLVFSGDRSTADILRSYPFLNGSLKGVNAVRIAQSPGNGTGVDLALPNTLGQSRVNLLFVYKKGPLVLDSNACGLKFTPTPHGCGLDVYADDGTGYKKALGWKYIGSAIHVSRTNGQVEVFIERSGEQQEFVLQGNSSTGRSFAFRTWHPRDCCGPALTHPVSPTSPP